MYYEFNRKIYICIKYISKNPEKWDGLDLVINKDRLRYIKIWLGDELVHH